MFFRDLLLVLLLGGASADSALERGDQLLVHDLPVEAM